MNDLKRGECGGEKSKCTCSDDGRPNGSDATGRVDRFEKSNSIADMRAGHGCFKHIK